MHVYVHIRGVGNQPTNVHSTQFSNIWHDKKYVYTIETILKI